MSRVAVVITALVLGGCGYFGAKNYDQRAMRMNVTSNDHGCVVDYAIGGVTGDGFGKPGKTFRLHEPVGVYPSD